MTKTGHVRRALLAAGLILGMGLPAAAAGSGSPPQVDTTRPHDQIYPLTAQRSGEQGDIYLKVYVHTNGKADQIQIAKSSGYTDLDNAAIQSVLNWRYVPATQNGDAVSDWMMLHIVYQLPPEQMGQK